MYQKRVTFCNFWNKNSHRNDCFWFLEFFQYDFHLPELGGVDNWLEKNIAPVAPGTNATESEKLYQGGDIFVLIMMRASIVSTTW